MRLALILACLVIGFASAPAVNGQVIQPQESTSITQTSWSPQGGSKGEIAKVIGAGLMLVGMLGMFVGCIYFIVRAFSVSATWGVFMLLFNGITIPLFCIFQFERARRPLGIFLLSIAAVIGGAFLSGAH